LTLTLKGVGNDSLLLDSVVKVSSFEFFLKQDTSFTAFVLSFPADDVDNDTLFIRHINKDKVISMDFVIIDRVKRIPLQERIEAP